MHDNDTVTNLYSTSYILLIPNSISKSQIFKISWGIPQSSTLLLLHVFCSAVGTLLELLYQSPRATFVACMTHLFNDMSLTLPQQEYFSGYATGGC